MNPTETVGVANRQPSNKKKRKVLVGVAFAVVAVATGLLVMSLTAQPKPDDFARLDSQRRALNASFEVYTPLVGEYGRILANLHAEKRSQEEIEAARSAMQSQFKKERELGEERLSRMSRSLAMKDDTVKASFEEYRSQQEAVMAYADSMQAGIINMGNSLRGPCAQIEEVSSNGGDVERYATDFIKVADACLAAISEAKEGSDKHLIRFLRENETMVREIRDKFKQSLDKDGLEATSVQFEAVNLMLQVNKKSRAAEEKYRVDSAREYEELAKKAKQSDEAFERALKQRIGVSSTSSESTRS